MDRIDVEALFGALKTKGEARLSDFATPIENDKQSDNPKNQEDKTMRLNMDANKKNNVNKNAAKQQVSNSTIVVNGTVVAEVENHTIEDAVAEEIVETPKAEQEKAPKHPVLKRKTKAAGTTAKAVYTLETYTTKKGGTAALIFGFPTAEDADALANKMAKSVGGSWRWDDKRETKRHCISLGTRYVDIAKDLCQALNNGDTAAIENACRRSIAIYEGVVTDAKAKREEAKAAKAAAKKTDGKPKAVAKPKPEEKTYTEKEVAALMKRIISGDKEAQRMVNELMKKAA